MAKTCGSVKNPLQAATSLGLQRHPVITQHILDTGSLDWATLRAVIYRCDVESRFQQRSAAGLQLAPGPAPAGDDAGNSDADRESVVDDNDLDNCGDDNENGDDNGGGSGNGAGGPPHVQELVREDPVANGPPGLLGHYACSSLSGTN